MRMAQEKIHVFEVKGLGKAPFRCVGIRENWFVIPGVPGSKKPGGTCNYCHTGIAYEFQILSADGKRFVVGCDCVNKTDDRGLIDAVKLAQKKRRQEIAIAEREARLEATRPQRERRQRTADILASERAFAARKREAAMVQRNGWLIDALNRAPGGFAANMAEMLRTNFIRDLSDRCIAIMRDIYAKQHGRRNSRAYDAAVEAFDAKISEGQEKGSAA